MNLARANRIFVFTKEPALGHALTSTEGRNHHLVVPESALWLNFKEIGQFVDDACVISRKHLVDNPMVCFTSLEREDVLLTGRLVLGYLQGYPKKLGSIHQTRPITVGSAGPRLEKGGKFGMTLAAGDRRLAQGTITLDGPAESNGFVNGHAMLHHRWFPRIELDGVDSLSEVVTMAGINLELGPVYGGRASLELFDSPSEELHLLQPEEIIGGYFRTVGTTFNGGTTLANE